MNSRRRVNSDVDDFVTSTSETEMRELALELLSTLHLNVPERNSLPSKGIPFSSLVDTVESQISNGRWFPAPLSGSPPIGGGARIEVRGREIWLHEQHDIGVGRYSDIASRRMSSLSDAVKAFVLANAGQSIAMAFSSTGRINFASAQQIVGPERSQLVFRSQDLNAWLVVHRPVNSTVGRYRIQTG